MNQPPTFDQVSIEQVGAYWDARPCNLRHSPQPVGSRAYFDEVEARKYQVEPHIPTFVDFARWRGKKVLEIGCGLGTDTINFARAGAQVTAVDLSEASLALARRRAEIFGLDITFHQGNAEELTSLVPIEPYDLIYSFGVIHHTPHSRRVIEDAPIYGPGQPPETHGLSPPCLEGVLDSPEIRPGSLLETGGTGGPPLRGPNRLSHYLYLYQGFDPGIAVRL